jgi:hypothetical protein
MKTRFAFLCLVLAASAGLCLAKEKPVIEKGMSHEMIVQLLGQPDEVNPLKTETGKAETWIYRRKVGQTVHQTANTQAFIPAMTGFTAGGVTIGKALVPDYRLKHVEAFQVTALLMVDGKLQLARQWYARNEEFAN